MTATTAPGSLAPEDYGTYDAPPTAGRGRLDHVDALRGLVMVLMLLDHTRDYVHWATNQFQPEDLTRASSALFLTRWVTHFCAPVFVFLAGLGAALSLARGRTRGELSRFLVTRGLILVALEVSVVHLAVTFRPDFNVQILTTLWALGVSMIVLAALVHLPWAAIAAVGVAIVLGHNLLDPITPQQFGPFGWLWHMLHDQGAWFPGAGSGVRPTAPPPWMILFLYPVLPWIGVMACGFAFARPYAADGPARRERALLLGAALTVAFFALRTLNVYGDRPWHAAATTTQTVLGLLNTTKYPPSLLFLLMTLGPALVLLAMLDRDRGVPRVLHPLVTFGRVPLFFYLLQFPLAHTIGIVLALAAGQPIDWAFGIPGSVPTKHGFGLGVTYAAWLAGTVMLYPVCAWYARLKARSSNRWLRYL